MYPLGKYPLAPSERDMVLDHLIADGTFDCQEMTPLQVRESFAMNHTSAMVQRLLMHIERAKSDVSGRPDLFLSSSSLSDYSFGMLGIA